MSGIEETRKIQEDASRQRQEDQQKLAKIKQEFQSKYQVPDRK